MATKIAAGVLVSGISALSGFTIYKSITPSTIGDELSASERISLLDASSEKWAELVKKHEETESQPPEKPQKIQGLELGNVDNEKQTKFKDKCRELWGSPLSDTNKERIKQEIKDWCSSDPQALKPKK